MSKTQITISRNASAKAEIASAKAAPKRVATARVLPTFHFEEEYWAQGMTRVVGVDEAGRGPLAGPVVAAAVILPRTFSSLHSAKLNDSKQLSPTLRAALAEEISACALWGIGVVEAEIIDEINIRQASWLAMKNAVADLQMRAPQQIAELDYTKFQSVILLQNPQIEYSKQSATNSDSGNSDFLEVTNTNFAAELSQNDTTNSRVNSANLCDENASDANSSTRFAVDFVLIDGLPYHDAAWPYKAIVRGDQKSLSIAAASVLAKSWRDHLMLELDLQFPEYGFARHKGYGTPQHLQALREFGACAIHRRTFGPVRAVMHDAAISSHPAPHFRTSGH